MDQCFAFSSVLFNTILAMLGFVSFKFFMTNGFQAYRINDFRIKPNRVVSSFVSGTDLGD